LGAAFWKKVKKLIHFYNLVKLDVSNFLTNFIEKGDSNQKLLISTYCKDKKG
jgi:hypothetical protein